MTRSVRFLVVLLVACGGGGGFPIDATGDPPVLRGRFMLAWSVTDANSQATTCADAGATTVSIEARPRSGGNGQVEVFSCTSAMGTSGLIPVGVWDFEFELIGTSTVMGEPQRGVEIAADRTTALATVEFSVP